jgi:hypothetical protein
MASVAGPRPACGLHPSGPSSGVQRVQPSSVRPSGVQRVQCPPVRCPPVQCPAVWCPACPASTRPVSGRLVSGRLVSTRLVSTRSVVSRLLSAPSVRTRPSHPTSAVALWTRSVRLATCTTGTGRGPGGRHAVERLGRRPSRPGRGEVAGVARWSVGSVADPGRVGCGRRPRFPRWGTRRGWPACGAPSLTAALWAREQAAARGGRSGRVAAALGLGWGPPRWVVVVVPAARVDGARKDQWACRRGWACGPSAAQAGSGRSWLAADSAVTCDDGWWACQDLNLGPHPYQQSRAYRYATLRFRVLLTFLWAA